MSTAVVPWRSFGMIEPFRQELETMFDRFLGDENGNGPALRTWAPRVDVEETDKEIVVKADVPGVDPKAVEVSIENGVLTIRGEKKEEKEERKKGYHRLERFAGSFFRAVTLPPGADADKVSATSTHGVVTITIPKKAEAHAKKISITPKA